MFRNHARISVVTSRPASALAGVCLCAVASWLSAGALPAAAADIIVKPPAWTLMGTQGDSRLGHSVAVAGDVNGDGYSDVIIGEYRATWGENAEGRAYLYYGGPAGIDDQTFVTLEENQGGAWLGYVVAPAGDVNGDGFHDVVVSALLWNESALDEGCVFLYLGSKEGLDPTPACRLFGGQENARFGYAASTAGDVNGDGYDDVIVGAIYFDYETEDEGRAFLFLGSKTGLSTTPAWEFGIGQRDAWLGASIATAGDVNGDGYSDVLVGAPRYDGNGVDSGRAFAFLGSDSGLADTPAWIGQIGFEGVYYGQCVASAGDINGDGYSDIMVGAPRFGVASGYSNGRFYLYFGSKEGLSGYVNWTDNLSSRDAKYGWSLATAGDVNGDGYGDILIGTGAGGFAVAYLGAPGSPNINSYWNAGIGGLFGFSVSTAGDVNGDGLSDIIVGAPEWDSTFHGKMGRVFVYYGAREVSELPNSRTHWVISSEGYAHFGAAIASAGDVNGDGCGDLLVGAYLADGESGETGRAFLYAGSRDGFQKTPAWSVSGTRLGAWFGWDVSYAGDVNGDGYSDVLIGSPRYSNGEFDEGAAFLFAGSETGLESEPSWRCEGGQDGAQCGFQVSRAGDVNGDGFGDILVSAYRYDGLYEDEGQVSLYLGAPWGFAGYADWSACGGQAGAWFGYSIATAGDLNGDGLSDVIIGAPLYDAGVSNEGRTFVYFGSPQGLSIEADWTFDGMMPEAHFGSAVAGAGDVHGDGFADILIAAENHISGIDARGRVVLFGGSPNGPGVWPEWIADAGQRSSGFGAAIGSAGDVNGDGCGDIFISQPEFELNGSAIGRVSIYTGSPDKLSPQPAWESTGYGGARIGHAVCAIRTMAGGGSTDLVIGAPTFPYDGRPAGAFFMYEMNEASFDFFAPRQIRTASGMPVDLNSLSDGDDSFGLRASGRMPFGRSDTGLEWEVKLFGTPFDGGGLGMSAPLDPGEPDEELPYRTGLEGVATGLIAGEAYCWRARQWNTSPYLPPRTGWIECPGVIEHEPHIRIGTIPPNPQMLPLALTLYSPYPNPFNPGTNISYRLSKEVPVALTIYDVLGRPVKTFPRALEEAGVRQVWWDGRNDNGDHAPSGVYFLRIDAGGALASRKLVLIR